MAEVGDVIIWGDPGNDAIIFRVGYDHDLEQIVDTLTREEWLAQEIWVRNEDMEAELDSDLADGKITREGRWDTLSRLDAEIHSEAGVLFLTDGNVGTWLAQYAIEAYGLPTSA